MPGKNNPSIQHKKGTDMKKFVNDPKNFVPEMLKGIALANPKTLKYIPEYNLIMRTDIPLADKVSIMQGSGSGHEPAHVMVVGRGMLDAACPGNVFAAPPADFVYQTTKLVASPKGVLHLLNNYTGDTMSFNMGREMAEAEGIEVRTVTINDDVAVKDSTWTIGRRGVAGNFFVMKATGAAAERGASLEALEALGNRVVSVTRTMGMALTGCTPPAKGTPIFTLADDEMEVGIGIHGEPGRKRVKLAPANAIVDELLEAVASDLPYKAGDDVALMINGMGGTPISELYLLYGYAHEQVEKRGIKVKRNYVGNYCTSLEMAGFSLTMVKLDPELEDLLAAPAEIAIRVF
jgi:dihydroxyacetone kinase-like protein